MEKRSKPEKYQEEQESKKCTISLHLLVKRNFAPEAASWSHEKILEKLNKTTHIRLDREKIGVIDNLELLGESVTNIYLQSNYIEKIENLDYLSNLQFLTLSANRLRRVEGLKHLHKLTFLDLSFNFIHNMDFDEVPCTVAFLNTKSNKCSQQPNYRLEAIKHLPRLFHLDEEEVTSQEKRQAGLELSDEEEESEEDEEDEESIELPGHLEREATFAMTSSEILLRSQDRMEEALIDHQKARSFLVDLRSNPEKTLQEWGN